ncbi:MAG: hypothetical protein CMK09_09810 [Ponticaulis sp.]|nr:hypothetical protein [Ponticaulis sp.]
MTAFSAITLRELRAFFGSPLAYVFFGVYILLSGLATWNLARFFDTARVELTPFFQFQPWFLAVLAPAIGMRLWSEDLKSGAADLYLTAPVSLVKVHLAKFAAGWIVLIAALATSLPYWAMVSWLGSPDHGVIFLCYLHLIGLSAVFLMITLAISAASTQQVVALVISVAICLILLVLQLNLVTDGLGAFAPRFLLQWVKGFGLSDLQLNALRGNLLISDLIVYAGLTALAGLMGLFLLRRRRHTGSRKAEHVWLAGTLGLVLVGFPIARFVLERVTAPIRMDMTGYQLNTLSDPAKDLARHLKEPVELTLFYSAGIGADYPNIRTHAERVQSLLSELVRASKGKLELRVIDPQPFSEGEDLAITSGITALPTEGVDPLYFGLTGRNAVDDLDIIPFLAPERDAELEFEITSLLSRLDRLATPKIGILSGVSALSQTASEAELSTLQSAIEAQYQVEWVSPTGYALPDDLDALMIAQPPFVSPQMSYLIERYLASGGRAVVLTDPAAIIHGREGVAPALSALADMLGVVLSDKMLADPDLGLPVSVQTSAGVQNIRQPIFPGPGPAQMNSDDFLTSSLQKAIHFGGAGWIDPAETQLTFTPLIMSGPQPSDVDPAAFQASDQSPGAVRQLMTPLLSPRALAVRLSGSLPFTGEAAPEMSFPDDPVLRRLAEADWARQTTEPLERAPAEIVWIHDADFLFDAFYVHPQTGDALADNESLVMSILDQFAGNPELARLRARPPAIRPMTRVISMREAAEAEYLEELTRLENELSNLQSSLDAAGTDERAMLRGDYLSTRRDLRALQANFRSRIDGLEAWLRWLTIWIPAGLVFLMSASLKLLSRRPR